jgi:hypothetical protein
VVGAPVMFMLGRQLATLVTRRATLPHLASITVYTGRS